jgi:uncharacterized membrane protein
LRDTYKPIVKLTFLAFALGAITCVPATILPLWLDEILQLLGTRDLRFSALLNYVADNAGGVPLGYLTQAATIHLIGYSVFAARLPSIVFGVLSYFGFGVLVLQAKLLWPSIGLLLFALLPLQIRYASEARPYEQALCLTTWCSVLFLEIVARPRAWKSVAYVLFVICAVYTQPFGLFVVVAHLSWSVLTWKSERMPQFGQPISNAGIAAIAGGLAFLPWFFFARNHWHQAISSAATGTGMNLKTPLLIFREITGAGFPGAVLISILVFIGLTATGRSRNERLFWGLALTTPMLLTVSADAAFGYFFAIRQLIFVLPALAMLAAFGLDAYMAKHEKAAVTVVTALFLTFLYSDFRFLTRPREDWQQASKMVETEVRTGACYDPLPESSGSLFEFFYPSLARHRCATTAQEHETVVATSPYANLNEIEQRRTELHKAHFRLVNPNLNRQPLVQLWQRPNVLP